MNSLNIASAGGQLAGCVRTGEGLARCGVAAWLVMAVVAITSLGLVSPACAEGSTLGWQALSDTSNRDKCKAMVFESPQAITIDLHDNIYFTNERGNKALQRLTPDGRIETLVDRQKLKDRHYLGLSLAVDSEGRVILGVGQRKTIELLGADGTLSLLAGTPGKAGFVDGAKAVALFGNPKSVAVGSSGNVYVADSRVIRKIAIDGSVVTLAGTQSANVYARDGRGPHAAFGSPNGITMDAAENLYVADGGTRKDEGRIVAFGLIRRVDAEGIVSTFAGSLNADGSNVDGTGAEAGFDVVDAIATDSANRDLFVTESYGSIRRIDAAGTVTSIVDHLRRYDEPADRDGANPIFKKLAGIAIDRHSQIYVVDSEAGKLHRIERDARVTTLCLQSSAVSAK